MSHKIFETKRLYLRPVHEDDAAFIFELVNTPKWLQFIGDRKVRSVEDARQYIIHKMYPQYERLGYGNYVVIHKTDNTKLGTCGLYDREGLEGVDIGFAFLPAFEKRGYAFEAASQIMVRGFTDFDLNQLSAITMQDNHSSQKLLVKLGFTRVGQVVIPNDTEKLELFVKNRNQTVMQEE